MNLEEMRRQFQATKESRTSKGKSEREKDPRILYLEEGKTKVRMVTPPDGQPIRPLHHHYNLNGTRSGVLCLKKNWNEKCPICEYGWEIYRSGNTDVSKKMLPKDYYYSPVLDRDASKEDRRVQWVKYPWKTHEELFENIILDKDVVAICSDITDMEKGIDLIFNRTDPSGGKDKRQTRTSVMLSPAGVTKALSAKETKELMETFVPLDEIYPKPTYKELEAILELHIKGELAEQDHGAEESEETPEADDGESSLDQLRKKFEKDMKSDE